MQTIQLEGFAELEQALQQLGREATQKASLRRALRQSAEPMAEIMRTLAPVDDGDLRDSIAVSTKLDRRQARQHRRMFRDDRAAVEMFVGPSYKLGAGGRHGHLQEFGTINHGPQPFARPAFDRDHGAMLDRLKVEIRQDIDRAVARAARRAARAAARG